LIEDTKTMAERIGYGASCTSVVDRSIVSGGDLDLMTNQN